MNDQNPIFTPSKLDIYTIEAGRAFLRDLAAGIHGISQSGQNKGGMLDLSHFNLADVEIYLPTRRAMRNLAAELIHQSPRKTSLLPKIQAIGALDDDIANLGEGGCFDNGTLPPAISPMERRLVLAFLIARQNEKFSGEENWATALSAADELAKLIDSFYTEEIPFSALDALTPDDSALAKHWQISREFLSIVTTSWPDYLAERGFLDPTERRIKLIHRAVDYFQENPPQNPVIIAGSTGSTPAVAKLMRITEHMPQACVILPSLDQHMDETGWKKIDDAHAQSGLKALLKRLEISRADVKSWPFHHGATAKPTMSQTTVPDIKQEDIKQEGTKQEGPTPRNTLLSMALRPANATDDWLNQIADIEDETFKKAAEGLKILECRDENHEATIIALLIRRALENPDQTIMLVTPDRDLTRRVSVKLKRWNIETDDSGGIPFQNTPCGTFLRLVSQWLIEPSNPVALLAVLRHPICKIQSGDIPTGRALGLLDKTLRGLKPSDGIEGIYKKIDQYDQYRAFENKKTKTLLTPLLQWIKTAYGFWEKALSDKTNKVSALLTAHLQAAEYLSQNHKKSDGEEKTENSSSLWHHEDGKTGAMVMAQLAQAVHLISPIPQSDYATIFSQLIIGETVRLTRPTHPRVFILGPLEARLQSANQIILSGLNETMWPGDALIDGFLSPLMRADINLPSPERRIGLSAHDFFQLASKSQVTLTRALRNNNAPAAPSRWLVRLNNILKGTNLLQTVYDHEEIFTLAKALDHAPKITPALPPRPCPPVSTRPQKLSVTRVEKWLRDPYFIYAQYILKLKKLDPFNDEFQPRHLGNIIHKVFETYVKTYSDEKLDKTTAQNRLQKLTTLLTQEIHHHTLTPTTQKLWHPAFEKSLIWFEGWHEDRLKIAKPVTIEEKGTWVFTPKPSKDAAPAIKTNPTPKFTLEAKADRIDLRVPHQTNGQMISTDTGVDIIDYKTGTIPTVKQIKTFAPQLSLTGLIVQANGFETINTSKILSQIFIKTLNRKSTGIIIDAKDESIVISPETEEIMQTTKQSLYDLILTFNDEATPYLSQPRSEFVDQYADYDHLARRAEWANENDDQGDAS